MKRATFVAGICFCLGLFALPSLKSYLHIDASLPILIILIQLVLALLVPVILGILQGLQRFMSFGAGLSSITLIRLLAAIPLVVMLRLGVNGALLSVAVGLGTALFFSSFFVRDILRLPRTPVPSDLYYEMARYSLPVLLSASMVMALGNLDVVLVRHYCTPEDAGLYATAAVLGRIAFFLPAVLVTVLFPQSVKDHAIGVENKSALWLSLTMTAILGGGFALVCILWPGQVTTLLYGQEYLNAAPLLQVTSSAMAMLAMANVLFTHSLARSNFVFLWFLTGGVGFMMALVSVFHATPLAIAQILLLSVGVILGGTFCWYVLRSKLPLCISDG